METLIYTKKFGTPVAHTVLPSGVNVFTITLPTKLVSVELVFPSGAYEDEEPWGKAHFLEHLMLKGPNRDGIHPLLRPSLLNGAEYNGATSYFCTRYSIEGLAGSFADMVQALARVCTEPCFTGDQVERERGVILQEARQRASGDAAQCWLQQRAYPSQSRLHGSVVAHPDQIQAITYDDLHEYVRREYQIEGAAFIAAGGITHEEHIEVVSNLRVVQAAHSPSRKAPRAVFPFNVFNDTYTGAGIDSPGLSLFFTGALAHDERRHIGLAQSVLDLPTFGLLVGKLRGEHRLVYHISANTWQHPLICFPIETRVDEKDIEKAITLILECLEDLRMDRYPDEVFRAVMAKRRIFFATRDESRSRHLYVSAARNMWLEGDCDDTDSEARVLATTREQIAAAAKKVYNPDHFGVVHWLPK